MNEANYKILIMAAGTGGHVFPALAVAELLRSQGVSVIWLGTPTGIEQKLVPAAGFELRQVTIRGLRGKGIAGWLSAPFRIGIALVQSIKIMRSVKPDVVLGMGGYVTGPAGVAAKLLLLPLVIHEQNRIPGLTNRLLGRIANRVLMAFPDAFNPSDKTRVVGNPVREQIIKIDPPAKRFTGREADLRILVLGGSQGAKALNEAVPDVLVRLKEFNVDVHHQSGERNYDDTRALYANAGINARVSSFIDDMAAEYAWADLVICRSGALTISELTAAGVGAVLIPFPYAVDDHQYMNATYMEQNRAAVIVRQLVNQPEKFVENLYECLLAILKAGRSALLKMAEQARQLAITDSSESVARICYEVQHG